MLSGEIAASGALDTLVKQFSSAFDCLRELVQNAIDAGSPSVEVAMDYTRGEGHEGTILIEVQDAGDGMDEAIIDKQLVRLFSSSKENDLTKIGKFGIGFVSVFALEPKHVVVRTGRNGESWEVLFFADRSFVKTRLDESVEGTCVSLVLEGDLARYEVLRRNAKEALDRWCSQAEVELSFTDRHEGAAPIAINAPFVVEGRFAARVARDEHEIVMAYSSPPTYGFYKRGLTLALTSSADTVIPERAELYSRVSFKIKSKWLGHTLSRETVVRDANYERAMRLVDEVRAKELHPKLVAALESLGGKPTFTASDLDRYAELARDFLGEPVELRTLARERPILRGLYGEIFTPKAVLEAMREHGRILMSPAPSALTERLSRDGAPILNGSASGDDEPHRTARALVVTTVTDALRSTALGAFTARFGANLGARVAAAIASPEDVYFPVLVDVDGPSGPLIDAAARLLAIVGLEYSPVVSCRAASPSVELPLFVVGRRLSELMARPPDGREAVRAGRLAVAVNVDHPHYRAIVRVFPSRPELASYCLAKSLLLVRDRSLELDEELMRAALGEDTDVGHR